MNNLYSLFTVVKKQRSSNDDIRTNLRSNMVKLKLSEITRAKKNKKYTFLCARYEGKARTVWISKKDYYKLRRMIKGLTPAGEIFKDNFFTKRALYDGEPHTLVLNPESTLSEKLRKDVDG